MTTPTIDGFHYQTLRGDDDVELNVAVGGIGPAIVLLHGFPQTHYMWHEVAPELADEHTVIVPDLRGYGASGKPTEDGPHTYSKRTMANDIVRVAAALGHERFGLIGHDRGALVGVRAGLDHPAAVQYLGILDVLPTLDTWDVLRGVDAKVAWHLYLMAQPAGLPEKMIKAVAEEFFASFLDAWDTDGSTFTPEVRRHYIGSAVGAVDSIVADYRASAGIDLTWIGQTARPGERSHAGRRDLPGLGRPVGIRRGGPLAGVGARPDLRADQRRPLHGRGEARRDHAVHPQTRRPRSNVTGCQPAGSGLQGGEFVAQAREGGVVIRGGRSGRGPQAAVVAGRPVRLVRTRPRSLSRR